MIDLRPHNEEAYKKVTEMIAEGKKRIAISHATGTGKSYIIAQLCEDYNQDKKLVLVPSNYIIEQMEKLFLKYHIGNTDFMPYQKLIKMSDEDIAAMDYQLIILDEYHHNTSKVWGSKIRHLMNTHSDAVIFGTSATPVRSDKINTIDALFDGNCASELPLSQSIAKKIVPLPKYVAALYTLDDELERLREKVDRATNTKEEKKEFYKRINAMRSQIEKSYGMPIILNKHIKDKQGKYLVFCKDKKHLDTIKDTAIEWFKTAGFKDIHAYTVYSKCAQKKAEYDAFCADTSSSLKLLFCVNMLNEGLHLDNISGVLLLRPTCSHIVFTQQIGRAIEAGNKETPIIFDCVNNFSGVRDGMNLLLEIKEALGKEKGENPDFDEEYFMDIDTFFITEMVQNVQDMFAEIEGALGGRAWTEKEIKILYKYFPLEGIKIEERLEGRSRTAIFSLASKLGIKAPDSNWTNKEIELLKKYYPKYGIKTDQFIKNRPISSIRDKANSLGIYVEKVGIFTKDEDGIIRKYYPVEGSDVYKRLKGKNGKQCRSRAGILGVKFQNISNWTIEEDEIIKKYYTSNSEKIKEKLPNRNALGIMSRASTLKIRKKALNWTLEEDNIIKKYYPIEKTYVCKRLIGRSRNSCMARARVLGISEKGSNAWSDNDLKLLREYYPLIGSDVSEKLNRTKNSCMAMASRLGIKAKERAVNIIDAKSNSILGTYASSIDAGKALVLEFHVLNDYKSCWVAIHNRLSGKVKNPVYKGRFIFQYADSTDQSEPA